MSANPFRPLAGDRFFVKPGATSSVPGLAVPLPGTEVVVDQDGLDEDGDVAIIWGEHGFGHSGFILPVYLVPADEVDRAVEKAAAELAAMPSAVEPTRGARR